MGQAARELQQAVECWERHLEEERLAKLTSEERGRELQDAIDRYMAKIAVDNPPKA